MFAEPHPEIASAGVLRRLVGRGHLPTLLVCWLHFFVSAFCWVLTAALVTSFAGELHLGRNAKAVIVGSSAIGTAITRLIVGPLADRFGMKRVGIALLFLSVAPLVWGSMAHSFGELVAVGALLGIAGASFGIALPLAGKTFDSAHQGIVLGLVGSGSGGTVASVLIAPWVASHVGWRATFLVALLPLGLTLLLFWAVAHEPSVETKTSAVRIAGWRRYARLPRETNALAGFYLLTFGGFLGLATYLPLYFKDRFAMTPVAAGAYAAGCGVLGALARPVGGALSDRRGALRNLSVIFTSVAVLCGALATLPPLVPTLACCTVMLALLGAGNGAVFQLVGKRLSQHAGTATGLIGAAGGLGGFLVPMSLASLASSTGTEAVGFATLGLAMALGTVGVLARQRTWRRADALAMNPITTQMVLT